MDPLDVEGTRRLRRGDVIVYRPLHHLWWCLSRPNRRLVRRSARDIWVNLLAYILATAMACVFEWRWARPFPVALLCLLHALVTFRQFPRAWSARIAMVAQLASIPFVGSLCTHVLLVTDVTENESPGTERSYCFLQLGWCSVELDWTTCRSEISVGLRDIGVPTGMLETSLVARTNGASRWWTHSNAQALTGLPFLFRHGVALGWLTSPTRLLRWFGTPSEGPGDTAPLASGCDLILRAWKIVTNDAVRFHEYLQLHPQSVVPSDFSLPLTVRLVHEHTVILRPVLDVFSFAELPSSSSTAASLSLSPEHVCCPQAHTNGQMPGSATTSSTASRDAEVSEPTDDEVDTCGSAFLVLLFAIVIGMVGDWVASAAYTDDPHWIKDLLVVRESWLDSELVPDVLIGINLVVSWIVFAIHERRWKLLTRLCVLYAVLILLRAIPMLMGTRYSDPDRGCQHPHPFDAHPRDDAHRSHTRDWGWNGCGQTMFSGHASILLATSLVMTLDAYPFWKKPWHYALWVFEIVYDTMSCLTILWARMHWTSDVLVAAMVTVLLTLYYYEVYTQLSRRICRRDGIDLRVERVPSASAP